MDVLNDFEEAEGKIILDEKLGQGSYGAVFKGSLLENENEKEVAVKVLDLEETDLGEIIKEINLMKKLNHPNILTLYAAFKHQDSLMLAMEHCGCGSILDVMRKVGKGFEEKQVSFVCREVLKGLEYLHSVNIIHRDIKAANILLTFDSQIKIADFGISTETAGNKRKTFIGSPYWMAPEVIMCEDNNKSGRVKNEDGYDEKADIWSLGITAIEMFQENPPLSDFHPLRAMFLISKMAPTTFASGPKIPSPSPPLRAFVNRCLQKDPLSRPSAKDLMIDPFLESKNQAHLANDNSKLNITCQKSQESEFFDDFLNGIEKENDQLQSECEELVAGVPVSSIVVEIEKTFFKGSNSSLAAEEKIMEEKLPLRKSILSKVSMESLQSLCRTGSLLASCESLVSKEVPIFEDSSESLPPSPLASSPLSSSPNSSVFILTVPSIESLALPDPISPIQISHSPSLPSISSSSSSIRSCHSISPSISTNNSLLQDLPFRQSILSKNREVIRRSLSIMTNIANMSHEEKEVWENIAIPSFSNPVTLAKLKYPIPFEITSMEPILGNRFIIGTTKGIFFLNEKGGLTPIISEINVVKMKIAQEIDTLIVLGGNKQNKLYHYEMEDIRKMVCGSIVQIESVKVEKSQEAKHFCVLSIDKSHFLSFVSRKKLHLFMWSTVHSTYKLLNVSFLPSFLPSFLFIIFFAINNSSLLKLINK